MILNAKFVHLRRTPRNGFSLVELVLSLAMLLVITTLAVPVVVRSLESYQLTSTASQLAGMLKFAKFDAIRRNTRVSCQVKQSGRIGRHDPRVGYRAIVTMPSGEEQVWTATSSGNWQRVS